MSKYLKVFPLVYWCLNLKTEHFTYSTLTMDQLGIEKRLSLSYLICIALGATASITTGVAWGHWYRTLDQCVGRNCSCIIYGKNTLNRFLGKLFYWIQGLWQHKMCRRRPSSMYLGDIWTTTLCVLLSLFHLLPWL